ncbi:MAG TPA: cell division protein FtsQ/DivIB [Devosia sp.]|nr:cell division protein FtsQ/DivIB [Devosia sp.]
MQQVGTKGFADAQLVDPRQLPVPIPDLARARMGLGRAWVLHRRLIVRAAAAGLVAVIGAGLLAEQDRVVEGAMALYAAAQGQIAHAGFGISRINITGQTLTSEADILKALAIPPDSSTLTFDADAALRRIEAIPSVKSANVRKIYPGEVQVSIVERAPMARWRIGDKTWLVDEDGNPIIADDGSFRSLPLVVGEGAADDAMVMIRALDKYPSLTEDLAALSRVGDRRWDLIFYSGLRVQLPENGTAQALAQLDQYQSDEQLLDRDVSVIDMRVPGMVSLKLGDLASKAWADLKKKDKRVVKGDAEYETAAERAAESKPQ